MSEITGSSTASSNGFSRSENHKRIAVRSETFKMTMARSCTTIVSLPRFWPNEPVRATVDVLSIRLAVKR